ncbi:right-handed parallel beta-helix repeat-containing protein [Butyrivibrio sp. INlla21]|uniref:right-handed parallel beta-helix repeat-containing protein n=1 Tax=Butyrivibrio sp. INlla21 TaxID=1520811 RepID=UPI0008E92BAF|nr:right-handed parallel beta-helix repeat-containing protein [Butyrivibrio sp. INlla21]SFU92331.1 Nitrous oxidase accessory protein NosD, contains tandem CASH domains [Butyrivibrio sp. INlla21]
MMKKNAGYVVSSLMIAGFAFMCSTGFCCKASAAAENGNTIKVGSDASTIAEAIDKASNGDTIVIPKGNYSEQLKIEKDGVKLVGEEGAVLNGAGLTPTKDDYAMINVHAKNVSISGLEITGLSQDHPSMDVKPMGIYVDAGSDGISISKCKIHDMGVKYTEESEYYNAHGILVYGQPESPVNGVSITGNEIYNMTLGNSEALVVNGNVGNFDISGNYVHNCDNIGIDAIGYERTNPETGELLLLESDRAHDGKIHDNTVVGISSAKNMTYFGDACADGIYVDGGKDIDIFNNYVSDSDIGIEIATEHHGTATTGIEVYNNTLVENNNLAGLVIGGCNPEENGEAKACHIYNNTVLNTDNTCITIQNAHDEENVIEKNIFIAANEAEVYYEECDDNSKGNTIRNNASNQKMRAGEDNITFKLIGVSTENNAIRLESTEELKGLGAASTKVIPMDFNED